MGEIVETDDGSFKAIDDNGDELENSPYETEKKAKIALNRSKVKYGADSDEDGQEEDSESEEESQEEEKEETQEETSEDNSEDQEDSSGFGVSLRLGAIALAVVLAINYLRGDSSSTSTETQEKQEETAEETEQTQNQDSRATAEDLF